MAFGASLERLLEKKDMSATELANRTGINRSTIYSFLRRDTKKVDPAVIKKLVEVLGEDVDDLLGHTTNDQTGEGSMGGPNFKPDVTRNGLDTYVSKRNGIQERYSHRVMNYQLEKIKALCEATGQRPSEVVNTLLDYALARVQVREITRVGLVFEDEPNDQTKEE